MVVVISNIHHSEECLSTFVPWILNNYYKLTHMEEGERFKQLMANFPDNFHLFCFILLFNQIIGVNWLSLKGNKEDNKLNLVIHPAEREIFKQITQNLYESDSYSPDDEDSDEDSEEMRIRRYFSEDNDESGEMETEGEDVGRSDTDEDSEEMMIRRYFF